MIHPSNHRGTIISCSFLISCSLTICSLFCFFFFECLSSQCILTWARVAKEGVLRVLTTTDACHVSPGSFSFWRGLAWNRSECVFPRVQADTTGHGIRTLISAQVSAGERGSAWLCLLPLECCVPLGAGSTEKQTDRPCLYLFSSSIVAQ